MLNLKCNNCLVEEVHFDLPEQFESVIDALLTSLSDDSGRVRWSSAKGILSLYFFFFCVLYFSIQLIEFNSNLGIARLCARLPSSLAGDVIEAALLDEDSGIHLSPSALHGACLLLAELLRRGYDSICLLVFLESIQTR